MPISNNYIKVEKVEEPAGEGFQTVQVQDSSIYKGKVVEIPECPVFLGNRQVEPGNIVHFAKYSPDTHDIEKYKFVKTSDILEVL